MNELPDLLRDILLSTAKYEISKAKFKFLFIYITPGEFFIYKRKEIRKNIDAFQDYAGINPGEILARALATR